MGEALKGSNLTEEEILKKMQEIQENFACTPNMIDGIGFCAKSFDKDGKLITTEEVITSNSK
ncbi:hypothetical protein [Spiroplasma eriocheiris]|uniref:Uncharacterized protein n=1 Tax=Spiroplasma eriocheiris TaxID=315358 RepID=A0A0H3XJ20_9MOLU|nr:hypothetical protein [Spiroplasma eriocheiris]AHF57321.1 hypothetical protein SPE_0187 [Spiroplasma eriocheiris CCTCC M 207170]AKM53781.1 hypothetical protein SERIO_v1c01880 [Spiroplasma eriocheiris]